MSAHTDSTATEPVRIGLNGFGRIGRNVLRAARSDDRVEVVAVNDVMDNDDMAYLLEYDSVHGHLEDVSRDGDTLVVADREIQLCTERDPTSLPWDDHDVDVAFEATGLFRTHDEAAQHLEAGADKVIISAPPKASSRSRCSSTASITTSTTARTSSRTLPVPRTRSRRSPSC